MSIKKQFISLLCILAAIGLILWGLSEGGFAKTQAKGSGICYECLGLE